MSDYDVFLGIDVGKTKHYAYALDSEGKKIKAAPVANTTDALMSMFTEVTQWGKVLVTVDQPNNIGKLAVVTAKHAGLDTAYLPGLAMRNMAKTYKGNAKNDKRDAYIIADTSRVRPEVLLPTDRENELFTALKYLNGIDEDLRRHCTSHINQIRASLLSCYPELEQVLTKTNLQKKWVLEMLIHYQSPHSMAAQDQKRLEAFAKTHGAVRYSSLIERIIAAAKAQKIAMPGTKQLIIGIKINAHQILELSRRREAVHREVEALACQLPQFDILLSMPGIGPQTAATILMCIGDISHFRTPAQLASYAGLCPQDRQSGTSINSSGPNRGGNKKLKNALWQSAFASIRFHERSHQYYDRKRAEHKRHNAAVMCLARRRCNVIFRMLKDMTYYHEQHPAQRQKQAV